MSTTRPTAQIDTLIIHSADTPNGACWCAEDIDDWHKERNFARNQLKGDRNETNVSPNLKHIGYHFVIETTGDVRRGRSLTEVGAHARGYNQNSIAICLIGTDKFTIDQWHALKCLVTSLQTRFKNRLNIIGHRMVNPAKTCPGFDVPAWLAGGMNKPADHALSHDYYLTDS